jgi:pyruvate/2-oxoglutarate dehydrogenase complex dihydrolipoamide acyltransferase (E2) component
VKEVRLPALSDEQVDATVIRWLRQEGERVEAGDPILEVETDKAAVEIESPAAGRLSGLRVKEGDVVPVDTVVAVIEESG